MSSVPPLIETKICHLPRVETLDLVEDTQQLKLISKSVFHGLELNQMKALLRDYQQYPSLPEFLKKYQIRVPKQHFSRHLPKVIYKLDIRCKDCGSDLFVRSGATRTEILIGKLNLVYCFSHRHWNWLEVPATEPSSTGHKPPSTFATLQSCDQQEFLKAILHRYVPECKKDRIIDYMEGRISLDDVQRATGVYIC